MRGDLVATLLDLQRRQEAGEIAYDRVLIETSGLADPAPILHALMTDHDVAQRHGLAGVTTLVDTVHGEATLAQLAEARRQVALADNLLLSKTDMAAPSVALREGLATLNPDAPLSDTTEVTPPALFVETTVNRDAESYARHTAGIESFVLQRERPVPALALTLLLQALAEHCGARLLRVKGLVAIEEMPGQPALIHGVQHVFSPPEFLERWPSDDQTTRMVFITQGVPRYFPVRLLDAIEQEVRAAMEQAGDVR